MKDVWESFLFLFYLDLSICCLLFLVALLFEEGAPFLGFFSSVGSNHLLSRWASTTPVRPKQRPRILIVPVSLPKARPNSNSSRSRPPGPALPGRPAPTFYDVMSYESLELAALCLVVLVLAF